MHGCPMHISSVIPPFIVINNRSMDSHGWMATGG